MNPKTAFLEIFDKLPKEARTELVYDFTGEPMTLNVIAMEVRGDTKLSKEILRKLGYISEERNGGSVGEQHSRNSHSEEHLKEGKRLHFERSTASKTDAPSTRNSSEDKRSKCPVCGSKDCWQG